MRFAESGRGEDVFRGSWARKRHGLLFCGADAAFGRGDGGACAVALASCKAAAGSGKLWSTLRVSRDILLCSPSRTCFALGNVGNFLCRQTVWRGVPTHGTPLFPVPAYLSYEVQGPVLGDVLFYADARLGGAGNRGARAGA